MNEVIVLDANVIVSDRWLQRAPIRALLDAKPKHFSLAIPEIALWEAVNNYRESLEAQGNAVIHADRKFKALRAKLPMGDVTGAVQDAVRTYEIDLLGLLKAGECTVLPLDLLGSPTHKELVQRALRRSKPFKADNDSGYRDALIWESIKRLANFENQIHFISANARDFASSLKGNDTLADDLNAELMAAGLPPSAVLLYPSVERFVHAKITPAKDLLHDLQIRMSADVEFRRLVRNGIEAQFIGRELDLGDYGLDNYIEDLEFAWSEITNVSDVTDISVVDVWQAGEDQFVATVEALVEVDLEIGVSDQLGGYLSFDSPGHQFRERLSGKYDAATALITHVSV